MEKGLVHIYTGDGKGKTSAAVGLAVRAAGWGLKVTVYQFQKTSKSGEIELLSRLSREDGSPYITVRRTDTVRGFIFEMNDEQKQTLRRDALNALDEIGRILEDGGCDMLVLDEIIGTVNNKILTDEEILETLARRKQGTEVVMTGRSASQKLIDAADYVSDIRCVKHPYNRNIKARKGIEF